MALPSQTERSNETSRPVMTRNGGVSRGPKFSTPLVAGVAAVVLVAGGVAAWRWNEGRKAGPSEVNGAVIEQPLKEVGGGVVTPTNAAVQTPAPAVPPPVSIMQGSGGGRANPPASTLGGAVSPGNVPVAAADPVTSPGLGQGTDQGKPQPVDVSRPDLKAVPPAVNPNGTQNPVLPPAAPTGGGDAASGGLTSTLSPSSVQSVIEMGDRAMAANKLVEARTHYSRALMNPQIAKGDQEVLRQKMSTINADLVFSPKVTPGDPLSEMYTVVAGDALEKIRKKRELTTEWMLIQRINGMASPDTLRVGQKLKLVRGPFHAIVNKSEFRMDLFVGSPDEQENWIYIRSFKVGLGEGNGTPVGTFTIRNKMQNPDWRNPRTGERFDRNDPMNPIGEYWLGWQGLGDSAPITGYGIHGTVDPSSVGQNKSMGCVRLLDEDIKFVYELLATKISVVKVLP